MAAWVFSGVLVGFMACLLLSLTLAAHCVNPARRHNSLRTLRLRWNWIGRHLFCGAWQVEVPDPVDDPWFRDPRRRGASPPGAATAGIAPALLALLPTHLVPMPTHSAASAQVAEGSAAKGEDGAEECAICQDEFCGGQSVAVLPCQHAFHEACIHKWLLRRATCPMCQREITEAAVKQQQQQGGQPGDVIVDVAPSASSSPPAASGSPQQPSSRPASASPQVGSNAQQPAADQQPQA